MSVFSAAGSIIRRFWKYLTPALILTIAIPLWQTYWVQTPNVHIEVTQVDRKPLQSARLIAIGGDDALRFLAEDNGIRILTTSKPVDVNDIDKLVDDYERENVTNVQKPLNELRKQLETLKPDALSWELAKILNEFGEVAEITRKDFEAGKSDKTYREDLAEKIRNKLQANIKSGADAMEVATQQVQAARGHLKALHDRLDNEEARIIVGCAVSNAGRGAISLRREAVLRVFLGSNNHIDADLTMDEYAANADLQPKHSRIVTLSSEPIHTLDQGVQDRIKSYWGQNVPCKLYVTDIDGKI